jgi:hypothetical protein
VKIPAMKKTGARTFAVLAVAAALVVSAGCGKSQKTESAADWANGACTAINTWISSLKSIQNNLSAAGIPTKQQIQNAGKQAEDATQTLSKSLKSLGKPNTQSGQQAKSTLDTLSTELDGDRQTVKDAVDSVKSLTDLPAAISKVSGAFASAQQQIGSAVTTLKGLDTKGELQSAFKQAPACASLKG